MFIYTLSEYLNLLIELFCMVNLDFSSLGSFWVCFLILCLARTVSEEWSSSGDSKTEDDEKERRSPREKDSREKDKDADCGFYFCCKIIFYCFNSLSGESFFIHTSNLNHRFVLLYSNKSKNQGARNLDHPRIQTFKNSDFKKFLGFYVWEHMQAYGH